MGVVAIEAKSRQKGFGNFSNSPKLSPSSARSYGKSSGIIFKQPRSRQQDLPLRLRKKMTRMSSDEDLTPPPSPKRSHHGGSDRPSKQQKRIENGGHSEFTFNQSPVF
jgi:hypothetical protein